jgi:hypothetical protein
LRSFSGKRQEEMDNEYYPNSFKAKTLLGEQKNEILLKLRQLPLEKLQELEKEHCEKIVLHSQNND